MNKFAIFVEGQTEQLFIEKVIKDIACVKQVSIVKRRAYGGRKANRNFEEILEVNAHSLKTDAEYFILVVDSGNDGKVKSDIRDQYNQLLEAGYQKILGIRDVYPDANYSELKRLRDGLMTMLPVGRVPILFILGVMEFESWILSEYNHFPKIHPGITVGRIKNELDIDVINDDLSQREKPSNDLDNIYWLENLRYDKSQKVINNMLSVLDYQHLKNIVSSKFSDLKILYQELALFFSN